jgi:cation-dependent mannose-6-phosphate receptor
MPSEGRSGAFFDGVRRADLLDRRRNDYEAVAGNETFRLNVCRGVVSELWKVENPENVGGYIPRLDGDFSIG